MAAVTEKARWRKAVQTQVRSAKPKAAAMPCQVLPSDLLLAEVLAGLGCWSVVEHNTGALSLEFSPSTQGELRSHENK